MSFSANNLRIGLEVDGVTKQLTNIDADEGTYDIVDAGGQIFSTRDAAPILRKLREKEPENTFVAIPA